MARDHIGTRRRTYSPRVHELPERPKTTHGYLDAGVVDEATPAQRIRWHERLQQAQALIVQTDDELDPDDEIKAELHDIAQRVHELAYELLGDAEDAT